MFRIAPQMPAGAYRTYQILAPVSTHWRPATCREVGCPNEERGWQTLADERTPLGQAQAGYIRHHAGRAYREARTPEGLTEFTFPAGQQCFAEHRTRLDRPELFVRRDGDWRGNPLGTEPVVHTRPELWVEDFALNQIALADTIKEG